MRQGVQRAEVGSEETTARHCQHSLHLSILAPSEWQWKQLWVTGSAFFALPLLLRVLPVAVFIEAPFEAIASEPLGRSRISSVVFSRQGCEIL